MRFFGLKKLFKKHIGVKFEPHSIFEMAMQLARQTVLQLCCSWPDKQCYNCVAAGQTDSVKIVL